jgi:hypothetical protein
MLRSERVNSRSGAKCVSGGHAFSSLSCQLLPRIVNRRDLTVRSSRVKSRSNQPTKSRFTCSDLRTFRSLHQIFLAFTLQADASLCASHCGLRLTMYNYCGRDALRAWAVQDCKIEKEAFSTLSTFPAFGGWPCFETVNKKRTSPRRVEGRLNFMTSITRLLAKLAVGACAVAGRHRRRRPRRTE